MKNKPQQDQKEKKHHGWFLRNFFKLIIVLMVLGILFGLAKMPKQDDETEPTEEPPVNVSVMTIVAEPELPDTFSLPAVVEPNRIVTISAEVSGRIEHITTSEGRNIKEGQLLIQLNQDLLLPQLEMAQAQVSRNQIKYDRMKGLVEKDATSQSDLDDATADLATSKAQLNEVQVQLERTSINTPLAGVLNDLIVEEGEYVQPGMAVAEVVETDTVKVAVDVPEKDISYFNIGEKAEVVVNNKGSETKLQGEITFINELADQSTRSTRIEISLKNDNKILRSGQIVRVNLTRRILKDAIIIPLLAVIPMEDGHAVYVANSSQAQRREVKLGVIKGDDIQIINGLSPGDKVIVAGHGFVAPGQKINIISEN